MEPFLKLVAEHLTSCHGEKVHEVCLLFPGRRAGVFFMKHFSEYVRNKPVWLPQIKTISELISDLSDLSVADPLILNYELFQVYKEIHKSEETFDTFYPFGEMLLNDFDDIDKYLVDTRQIFKNISDLKDIDNSFALTQSQIETIQQFWKNITIYEAGPLKRDFIGLWNQLHQIYEQFNRNLRKRGIAYEGMIYREVCEKINSGSSPEMPFKRFAVIGFNALNECEKVFFTFLQKNKIADFYWDYDNYYVQNKWHEAGFFQRENLDKFPNALSPSHFSNLTQNKNIEFVSVSSDVGQAKILPELLIKDNEPEKYNDTIIVLADEQLLIPVLTSLPDPIKDVNVSLGYPFRLTPVYSFLESLISLQKNIRKSGGIKKFYHKDIIAILNHPYIQTITPSDCTQLTRHIITNNRVFMASDELSINPYFQKIFSFPETALSYMNYLLDCSALIIEGLRTSMPEDNRRDFQLDYWFTFLTALNRLNEIMVREPLDFGLPIMFRLIRKITGGLTIPFKGEPLAGLQVMGVLETRAIDFRKVILLSANEGIFPKNEAAVSYIPYNLRKGFGLPTIEHQDAIFAYYYYRLLQRAQDITITYNTQPNNRSGEMSRYLYQMKYENVFTVNERNVGFSISLSDEKNFTIPKNDEILNFLKIYLKDGEKFLPPTALSAYMQCSLQFYFKYIAKIKEKEEINEDIESSVFGKLLHYAMEFIYKPYEGTLLTTENFNNINKPEIINNAILESFKVIYFKGGNPGDQLHGKNIIIKEILQKYITEILVKDIKNLPFTIISLEEKYSAVFELENKQVVIGGVIDRLDQVNGSIRIIDYKTGHTESSCSSLEVLFNRDGDTSKYSAIFQSMLYAVVIKSKTEFSSLPVYPGIYSLRKIFANDFDCTISVNKQKVADISEYSNEYEMNLKAIISELFDHSVPFTKTQDKKKCERCAYNEICQR
jgi:hypothetical protein